MYSAQEPRTAIKKVFYILNDFYLNPEADTWVNTLLRGGEQALVVLYNKVKASL